MTTDAQTLRFKATMDAAQALHALDGDEPIWIPYADVGRELLAAGLVDRVEDDGDLVLYRLTEAGKRWRSK